jgi:hypothetical protein
MNIFVYHHCDGNLLIPSKLAVSINVSLQLVSYRYVDTSSSACVCLAWNTGDGNVNILHSAGDFQEFHLYPVLVVSHENKYLSLHFLQIFVLLFFLYVYAYAIYIII